MTAFPIRPSLKFSPHAFLFLASFLLSSPSLKAQLRPAAAPGGQASNTAPSTPDASTGASLSTDVDEVSLDLTVRTKHNKPVVDLEPSQLTVIDAGSPVQLSSLRLVTAESGSQHLVTFVFDRLDPASAKKAREIAEKVLGVFPEKGFSYTVLQMNGRLRLLQPYTPDRQLIEKAVDDATPQVPRAPAADLTAAEKAITASLTSDALAISSEDRANNKMLLSALEGSQRILEEDRNRPPSLSALQAVVNSERLLTGRKFIVYVSEGIASDNQARDAMQSIVGIANRAGVTICVVDTSTFDPRMRSSMQASQASAVLGGSNGGTPTSAFGVGTMPGSSISSSYNNGNDPLAAVHNISGFQFGNFDSSDSPLVSAAISTGGFYFGSSGGLNHQLVRLHDSLASWYQASWKPPIEKFNGDFRPISVHSLRRDVVIHARSGYFAVRPSESTGIRPFEMPLLNILASPSLPDNIAFHAGVLHLGELPDGNAGEIAVQVPVSELAVHEDTNAHISSTHASVVAVIKDGKGAILQRFGEDFPMYQPTSMAQANSGRVLTLEQHFSAEPGNYTLEAAVMDRISNKAGAQSIPFTIEPAPKGPSLSDVALVESVKPVDEDNEAFEPMRFGDGHIVPNMAMQLPSDRHTISLFFLIHPVAGSQNQPVLRMQISRNGRQLAEMPLQLDKVSGSGNAVPYLGTIRGNSFAPGDYQVKALISQDGATASSSLSFTVAGDGSTANGSDASLSSSGPGDADAINSRVVSEASTANSQFVLSSPKDPIPPPTDAENEALIEGARKRALSWSDSLVNFYCYELTNHSVDVTGNGDWRHKDTLVELMKYVDHGESRSTVMLNGDRSDVHPDQLQFFHSAGEFGAMFQIIFNPSAKAEFHWKETAFIDGQPIQVFTVKVARENSSYDLEDRDGRGGRAGFKGLVYIDPETFSVRRITINADDIPSQLLIRASSMSVDYGWVPMDGGDFLLPIRGAVSLQQTKSRAVLNEFEFLNYRRFGSQSKIVANAGTNDAK